MITARIIVASIILAGSVDRLERPRRILGRSIPASSSRSGAPPRPAAPLHAAVLRMRVPEAHQVQRLVLACSAAPEPLA